MLEAAQEQERAALEKAAMDQFGYTLVTNCPKPASEPGQTANSAVALRFSRSAA